MKNLEAKLKRESKKSSKEKEIKSNELLIGNIKRTNHSRNTVSNSNSLNTI